MAYLFTEMVVLYFLLTLVFYGKIEFHYANAYLILIYFSLLLLFFKFLHVLSIRADFLGIFSFSS